MPEAVRMMIGVRSVTRAWLRGGGHATSTTAILERLAQLRPAMLACQHGSAYRGDGAALLRELAATIPKGTAKLSEQLQSAPA